jgi:hypothetical protein
VRDDKQKEAQLFYDDDPPETAGVIDGERPHLILTCCHPALSMPTPRGADDAVISTPAQDLPHRGLVRRHPAAPGTS